jgi:dolichol kinase
MTKELLPLLALSGLFLGLFILGEVLYHVFKVQAEFTRKLIHIGTGMLTMLFPLYLSHPLSVVAICGSFLLLLSLSLRFRFLRSINAIDRKSHGSILYPVIVVMAYVFYHYKSVSCGPDPSPCYVYFYLPVLIMALADPCAAIVGKALGWIPYTVFGETKSVAGSLAFFLVALGLSSFFLWDAPMGFLLIIPLLSTLAEAVSTKGTDNFTIPISVMLALYFHNI